MEAFASPNFKKVILYYFIFCVGFVFLHISLISIFTFFHFLLDHDMGTIENWLNRNGWEILTFSKAICFFLVSKIFQINSYQDLHPIKSLLKKLSFPSIKIFGMSFFLLAIVYIYLFEIEGVTTNILFQEGFFYSSFLGACSYYIFDFLLIIILYEYYQLSFNELSMVTYTSMLFFIVTSKIALPYLSKYYIFILIHFLTLFFIHRKGALIDCFVYCIFVIAPLSAIYGLDLVWDNSYGLFNFTQKTPIVGFLGIWCLALGYYRFSRLN